MQDCQNKTDAELVSLSLKNPDVFAVLMQRYEKKFFRYVKRFASLENESVEDILQEVFIKIYLNLNDYNPDFTFSSWAYRIAHNEAINYIRKHKKLKTVPLETNEEETGDLINVLKSETNIAKDVSRKDMKERVQSAINMLPGKYREILILRYIEDFEYQEISDILKIPMGTVATNINRAKSKFREIALKNQLTTT
jgi:RNA polymerase sigma-70 factor (ECF subfamily)